MQIHKWMNMVLLSIIVAAAVMSWDHTTAYAMESKAKNSDAEVQKSIPEDAIRLRILAHSDAEDDQAVKRKVRDQIVLNINTWLGEQAQPATRAEARAFIEAHLEELQETAREVVEQEGMDYSVKAELKVVPFPAKLYGGEVYPAGDYEALRITLGEGSGQNWWCVLFPPLCFVDGSEGTATAAEQNADQKSAADQSQASDASGEQAQDQTSNQDAAEQKEVRFFLFDMLAAIFQWVMEMIHALFG